MSDNNTKLIQEALDGYELHGSSDNAAVSQGWITAAHLAHALDAAEQRIAELEAENEDWRAITEGAERKRDALAAVIEQAKAALNRKHIINWENGQEARRAIAAADTDAALRERDAEKWDEGLEAGATWTQSTPRGIPVDPPLNPYREPNA